MIRKEEIELAKDAYMRRIGAEPRVDEDRNNLDVTDAYIAGAKWADCTMIERASQWLTNNAHEYLDANNGYDTYKMIEEFQKAMYK